MKAAPWILVLICIVVLVWDKMKQRKNIVAPEPKAEIPNDDFSKSYQAKYLLTKNEWYEHKKLQKFTNEKGLVVCPKVRLLDIIEPRRGENNYKSLMYKVQAKHIDFLICDHSMHIKAVIELDDNSHNQKDRQNRDAFVDQILTSVGYKVIRTHSITEVTLSEINNA